MLAPADAAAAGATVVGTGEGKYCAPLAGQDITGPADPEAALDDAPSADPADWPVARRSMPRSLCGSAESNRGRACRSLLCGANLTVAELFEDPSASIG